MSRPQLLFTVLVVVAWCAACEACASTPTVPYPDLSGDAGPDGCTNACAALQGAGCPEAGFSPGGASCVGVCLNAPAMLPVACVANSGGNVDAIRRCGVRCQR